MLMVYGWAFYNFYPKNYFAWAIYLIAVLIVLFSWDETNGFTDIDDDISSKSYLALILTSVIFLTAFMECFAQIYQPKLIVLDFVNQTVTVENKPKKFKTLIYLNYPKKLDINFIV